MDDNIPYISVMILCYNYGHLLKKALDACAAQTFRDFEIVMINNGSTDNTEEVYREFCRENPGIRTTYVPVYPNQGPCHGWNEGLDHACGEYVMLCDADDWMDPDCLEKLALKAKETDADRVTCQYREVMQDGSVYRDRVFPRPGRGGEHRVYTGMLQGVIFRRNVIEENSIRLPENRKLVCQDFWFTLRFAYAEKSCAILRETLYNYYYNNPVSAISNVLKFIPCEEYYERMLFPTFDEIGKMVRKMNIECTDTRLIYEISYNLIKLYYNFVLTSFQRYRYRESKLSYRKTKAIIKQYIPDYLKNPLLWPFNNGYDFLVGFVIYCVSWMERLHLTFLLKLVGILTKMTKRLR